MKKKEVKEIEFKHNLAMKITKEQFKNDIELPLIALGYEIIDPVAWGDYLIFVTNWMNEKGRCSNVMFENKESFNRIYIESYDLKLFLHMASQTQPIKEKKDKKPVI